MNEIKRTKTSTEERRLSQVIGGRIRTIRAQRNVSQEALAGELDITFQQLQKIENGLNRCSTARLMQIAAALRRPITDFLPLSVDAGLIEEISPLAQISGHHMQLFRHLALLTSPQRQLIYGMASELADRTKPRREPVPVTIAHRMEPAR